MRKSLLALYTGLSLTGACVMAVSIFSKPELVAYGAVDTDNTVPNNNLNNNRVDPCPNPNEVPSQEGQIQEGPIQEGPGRINNNGVRGAPGTLPEDTGEQGTEPGMGTSGSGAGAPGAPGTPGTGQTIGQ